MQLHKEKENKKNLKTFQFDDNILFAKPKINQSEEDQMSEKTRRAWKYFRLMILNRKKKE